MAMISAMQPPVVSSKRLGPGGPPREIAHPTALEADHTDSFKGSVLAQEEVTSSLHKAKKMQVRPQMFLLADKSLGGQCAITPDPTPCTFGYTSV